ncbi:STAS-like domain-containing protein [Halarcobacter sp.]|uniref:STAS-like domain-containing protein n=1 Tax=Halarcobacter sp. TaxID=2321133 RepID=UPI003A8F9366
MSNKTISIASDFTEIPGARYYSDGDFPGEEFRDKFLVPNFDKFDKLIINLDGTEGIATSFSEEAFGGLARIYPENQVLEKLEFISDEEPDLIKEIKKYIIEARTGKNNKTSEST